MLKILSVREFLVKTVGIFDLNIENLTWNWRENKKIPLQAAPLPIQVYGLRILLLDRAGGGVGFKSPFFPSPWPTEIHDITRLPLWLLKFCTTFYLVHRSLAEKGDPEPVLLS